MCSAQVYPINKDSRHSVVSSRIGCLIEVDSHLYGLTSAHGYRAFTNNFSPKSRDNKGDSNSDTNTNCKERDPDTNIVEDDDINFDDDEYDLSSEDEASNRDISSNTGVLRE